ncbi:MAG: DUF4298 domain-containing protein [Alloprevotella sp.]|nr:DUF4298 domain-containing protein [Alloprevotella sp.]
MKKKTRSGEERAQLCRIFHMETQMVHAGYALDILKKALDLYEARAGIFEELERYLASPEWRADYEAEESGAFSDAFPRGVLSEDGLYQLLQEHDEVRRRLVQIFASPRPSDQILAD